MTRGRSSRAGEIVADLLARRGIDRHVLFLTQQEGKMLPGGVESLSGFVLTGQGEVYGFWLEWDDAADGYTLDPWYRVEDPSLFAGDPEYRRARRQLGLDSAERR